jgi:uncharacterized protein YndB with AHSA1/START domain
LRASDEAVEAATGRDWDGWLAVLDAVGADRMGHKGIVALLDGDHPEVPSNWWRQAISMHYEAERGLRVPGETADVGFEVGVRRTIGLDVEAAWALLVDRPELWLGDGAEVDLTPGTTYEVPPGDGAPAATGEVRVVTPGDRLRMTWHPAGWRSPATIQLVVRASGPDRTAITAHVEKLPDADVREEVRGRWRAALDRVSEAATTSG